jgi:hypothetical protein
MADSNPSLRTIDSTHPSSPKWSATLNTSPDSDQFRAVLPRSTQFGKRGTGPAESSFGRLKPAPERAPASILNPGHLASPQRVSLNIPTDHKEVHLLRRREMVVASSFPLPRGQNRSLPEAWAPPKRPDPFVFTNQCKAFFPLSPPFHAAFVPIHADPGSVTLTGRYWPSHIYYLPTPC